MFTPILGRVSVQNASPSPGAWAQHHPVNKLNTIVTMTTATRHFMFPDNFMFPDISKSFLFLSWANSLLERD